MASDQVADEAEDRVAADEELAAGLGSLLGEPLKRFDTLPTDKQARIDQILSLSRGVRGAGRMTPWRRSRRGWYVIAPVL